MKNNMKTKQVKNAVASILYLVVLCGLYMQGTCSIDTALFVTGIIILVVVQGLYLKNKILN